MRRPCKTCRSDGRGHHGEQDYRRIVMDFGIFRSAARVTASNRTIPLSSCLFLAVILIAGPHYKEWTTNSALEYPNVGCTSLKEVLFRNGHTSGTNSGRSGYCCCGAQESRRPRGRAPAWTADTANPREPAYISEGVCALQVCCAVCRLPEGALTVGKVHRMGAGIRRNLLGK